MKPGYINGLLVASFILFVIVYWAVRIPAVRAPEEASARSASSAAPAIPRVPGTITDSEAPGFAGEIERLKERITHAPGDTTLLNHLAQLLHDAGRYPEAATYYQRYLEGAPGNAQGWLDLANVYAALKDWERAIQASESLLAIDPGHPSAMYNMGAIYANTARHDEAIFWWNQVRDQQRDRALAAQAAQNIQQLQGSPAYQQQAGLSTP